LNDATTYPPSPPPSTLTVPPSSPTAFTGSGGDLPIAAGALVGLVVVAAVVFRVASSRARRLVKSSA
jgi:hypothetical protein